MESILVEVFEGRLNSEASNVQLEFENAFQQCNNIIKQELEKSPEPEKFEQRFKKILKKGVDYIFRNQDFSSSSKTSAINDIINSLKSAEFTELSPSHSTYRSDKEHYSQIYEYLKTQQEKFTEKVDKSEKRVFWQKDKKVKQALLNSMSIREYPKTFKERELLSGNIAQWRVYPASLSLLTFPFPIKLRL